MDHSSSDSESDETLNITKNSEQVLSSITNEPTARENNCNLSTKNRYMFIYDKFIKWRTENNLEENFSEATLMKYFYELAQTKKPTTLWSSYSMLKSTIIANHDIDIQVYTKLRHFLKMQNIGYRYNKSKPFTTEEVNTFLNEAPDQKYLAIKVVLIFGIAGACKTSDMLSIKQEDITKQGEMFVVNLSRNSGDNASSSTLTDRAFVIRENVSPLVQKYIDLRPKTLKSNRFFIKYCNGKCYNQVMGKNVFSALPNRIATYLNLPTPELYTGHSYRATAQKLRSSGSNLLLLTDFGGKNASEVSAEQNESLNKNHFMVSIETEALMDAGLEGNTNSNGDSPMQHHENENQPGNEIRIKLVKLWGELTQLLYSDTAGNSKTEGQWRKVWNNMRNKAKRKIKMLIDNQQELSDFDRRMLQIIEEVESKQGEDFNQEVNGDANAGCADVPALDTIVCKEEQPDDYWNDPSTSYQQRTQNQHANGSIRNDPLSNDQTKGVPLSHQKRLLNSDDDSDDDEPLVKKPKIASENFEEFIKLEIEARKNERKRHEEFLEIERERIRQRDAELQLQSRWQELMKEGLRVLEKHLDRRSSTW